MSASDELLAEAGRRVAGGLGFAAPETGDLITRLAACVRALEAEREGFRTAIDQSLDGLSVAMSITGKRPKEYDGARTKLRTALEVFRRLRAALKKDPVP